MKNLLEKTRVKTASQMYNGRLIYNEINEKCRQRSDEATI
jgi:hypothetical protein